MVLLRWILIAGLLTVAAPALAQDKAPVAPGAPPLEAFYDDPVYSAPALSPNGQYMAGAQTDGVSAVTVTDLKTEKTVPVLPLVAKGAAVKGATVDWIEWKGNDRLLVGVTLLDIERQGGKADGDIIGWRYGRFIFAIDRDGKNAVQLLKGGFWNSSRGADVALLDRLRDDPDHVLTIAPMADGSSAVWKADTKTGEAVMIEPGSDEILGWKTDSTGAVVARYRALWSGLVIEGRAPGQKGWTTIVKLRPKDLKSLPDFEILGPTDKPAQFYVAVKPKDKTEGDFRSLRTYDLVSKTLSDPVWPALKYDVEDIVYDGDSDRLAGVCYTVDVYVCTFKDKTVTANLRGISKYFGDQRNIYPISVTGDARWWLFSVSGADEPNSYYLFDWQTKQIELLAERYGRLPSEQLAPMRTWSYSSRDGVTIPAYLTQPRGAAPGPLPLIVMPHGGPEVRDSLGYNPWVEFLATRGYLVFQPNYRGSGGYGVSYGEAGYGQWGGRMADDITDGVRKLIEAGLADPKRICIFGASYGGYAALYAGATHPELYKCVVSWAGDADLMRSMKFERDFGGTDTPRYQYWLKSIGDPDKQKDALKAASPVTYAASYQPPVLLIHGADDTTVSPDQSRLMESALKKTGKDVKLIMFKNEDHTDWDKDHEMPAITAVANFIEAHIKPAPPAPAPAAPPAAASQKPVGAH
jgi:dipeptidyl aminopeptidase/acylaminoacyl peptidase